jgi:hypothetical protein
VARVSDEQLDPRPGEGLLLLALLTALVFLGVMLASTSGHFIPQVVDLYLVCQYARAFAEGHPFQYNPGEAPSTGSTSLLYTVYLGIFHRVGVRGEGLIVVAVLTGLAFYLLAVATAYRIGRLLGEERDARLGAALVVLGGPVVWGFLYGSDVALFMFLMLWLLEGSLRAWQLESPGPVLLPGCALSLSRPEGLVVGIALGLAMTRRLRRTTGFLLAWLPAAVALAVLALYRLITGSWVGSSVQDKSLFASYGFRDGMSMAAEYLTGILRGMLLGFYPPETPLGLFKGWSPYYLPPLALVFVIAAFARPREEYRTPLRLFGLLMALLALLVTPNMFMGVHFNRYLMWSFPILLVLTAVGFGSAVRGIAKGDGNEGSRLFWAGAGLFLLSGVLSTLRFAGIYGELAGEVARRDVAAARWISEAMSDGRLPRGARMADVATSVEYLTGHHNINLHGVTSPDFFGNRPAEREAEVFEALGRMGPSERPEFLISSLSAQESYPSLKALVQEPPLFVTTSGSDELVVYRMLPDALVRNQTFVLPKTLEAVAGLREVDRLNVCDSRAEARHGYRFESRLGDLHLNGAVRSESYALKGESTAVLDGGRAILGEESFRISTEPGREMVVLLRTAATAAATALRPAGPLNITLGFPRAGFEVEVNGHALGRVEFQPRAGWDEVAFRIPGRLIPGSETSLRLRGRYASFYYWFYQ